MLFRSLPQEDAYSKMAAYQMVKGPFNINSTNVEAWKATLASLSREEIVTIWPKSAAYDALTPDQAPVLPMALLNGGPDGVATDPNNIDTDDRTIPWNSYQTLDNDELETLATSIVEQVRLRGPFLSMSEFVNRRIGPNSGETRSGALEAAIGDAQINDPDFAQQIELESGDLSGPEYPDYNTPDSLYGNTAGGAPGWEPQHRI